MRLIGWMKWQNTKFLRCLIQNLGNPASDPKLPGRDVILGSVTVARLDRQNIKTSATFFYLHKEICNRIIQNLVVLTGL